MPLIPIEVALWAVDDVANYLRRDAKVVRERIVVQESFPRPIRIPVSGTRRSQALYKASEVVAWAHQFQES